MAEFLMKKKARAFGVKIFKLTRRLRGEYREYEVTGQLVRSGTSVGANIYESEYAESLPDYIHKQSIAQKEANETIYWLDVLHDADVLDTETYSNMTKECEELLKMLTASIRTAKKHSQENETPRKATNN